MGIAFQVKHNMKGHGTFILGESHEAAVRHYFPVALSMKLTIPVLVLLLLACRRGGILADPVGWIAVIMFLMSVNYRVQIGIRIVMPLVVLLIVAAAEALGRWLNRLPQGKSWAAVLGVSGLLAIPQAATYPNGISYFNRLWGGPERGYRLLSDSNYDWGQGLLELGEWQRAHADRPLKIWYFGLDPRAKQSPFELLQLHGEEHASLDDFPPLVNGGYLAVSHHALVRERPHLYAVVEAGGRETSRDAAGGADGDVHHLRRARLVTREFWRRAGSVSDRSDWKVCGWHDFR